MSPFLHSLHELPWCMRSLCHETWQNILPKAVDILPHPTGLWQCPVLWRGLWRHCVVLLLSLILCHFFPEEQIPGSCWYKENKGWVELAWTWTVFRSRTSPGSSQVCKKMHVCCCTSLQFWDFCYTANTDLVSIGIPTLPQLTLLGKRTCRTVASVRNNLCAWTCQLRHHDSQNQIHWPFQKTLTWKYPSFELESETHKIFYYFKKHQMNIIEKRNSGMIRGPRIFALYSPRSIGGHLK